MKKSILSLALLLSAPLYSTGVYTTFLKALTQYQSNPTPANMQKVKDAYDRVLDPRSGAGKSERGGLLPGGNAIQRALATTPGLVQPLVDYIEGRHITDAERAELERQAKEAEQAAAAQKAEQERREKEVAAQIERLEDQIRAQREEAEEIHQSKSVSEAKISGLREALDALEDVSQLQSAQDKAKIRELEQKLTQVETQLESSVNKTEVESLEKRNKELEARLKELAAKLPEVAKEEIEKARIKAETQARIFALTKAGNDFYTEISKRIKERINLASPEQKNRLTELEQEFNKYIKELESLTFTKPENEWEGKEKELLQAINNTRVALQNIVGIIGAAQEKSILDVAQQLLKEFEDNLAPKQAVLRSMPVKAQNEARPFVEIVEKAINKLKSIKTEIAAKEDEQVFIEYAKNVPLALAEIQKIIDRPVELPDTNAAVKALRSELQAASLSSDIKVVEKALEAYENADKAVRDKVKVSYKKAFTKFAALASPTPPVRPIESVADKFVNQYTHAKTVQDIETIRADYRRAISGLNPEDRNRVHNAYSSKYADILADMFTKATKDAQFTKAAEVYNLVNDLNEADNIRVKKAMDDVSHKIYPSTSTAIIPATETPQDVNGKLKQALVEYDAAVRAKTADAYQKAKTKLEAARANYGKTWWWQRDDETKTLIEVVDRRLKYIDEDIKKVTPSQPSTTPVGQEVGKNYAAMSSHDLKTLLDNLIAKDLTDEGLTPAEKAEVKAALAVYETRADKDATTVQAAQGI